MPSYLSRYNPSRPPQTEPLDDRQVLNAAGGYVYGIDNFAALNRFLILGTQGGSLYESERELTKQNFENIIEAIKTDGVRVVDITRDVSVNGRARKNDMALFVLALCMTHGDDKTKKAVAEVYNDVARIGTHHFMFVDFVNNMRGWGDALMKVVSNWYTSKSTDALAYQVTKYRNRENWTHKNVLNRCHVGRWNSKTTNTPLYRWIIGSDCDQRIIKRKKDSDEFTRYPAVSETVVGMADYPRIVQGFMQAQELNGLIPTAGRAKHLCSLIKDYGLTHEMIPNTYKDRKEVWEVLLEKMPIGATLRNLGKLSSLGLLEPLSENQKIVMERFTPESVKKGRLHPLAILVALRTYAGGKGVKGDLKWTPNQQILTRLEEAFYWGFDAIKPSGKNMLIALDVSGSMFSDHWWDHGSSLPFPSCPNLMCGEIAAVMAMATARVEPNYVICGFDHTFSELPITHTMTLQDVIRVIRDREFGATDASLPMVEAYRRRWHNVEGFALYTDNDTYIGDVHPKQALEDYRNKTGMDSRLVAVSMLATDKTITDQAEPYMFDFVGMSTDTPRQVSAFMKGEF